MNAILQCLNNTMPLLEYFISNKYKNDVNLDKIEKYIVEHWNVVSRSLWFSNNIVSPQQLHSSISMVVLKRGLNQFQNYSQNDSQEFLQFFLESLHTALSKEVVMKINGSATNKLDNYALIALESWSKFFSKEYSKIIELENRIEVLEDENASTTNELYRMENSLDARIDILTLEFVTKFRSEGANL